MLFSSFNLSNAPKVFEFLKQMPKCRKEHNAFMRTFAEVMKYFYEIKERDIMIFMEKTLLTPELYSRTQKENNKVARTQRILIRALSSH